MKTDTSASAIRRCSRVHGCPSVRRHADCQPEGGKKSQNQKCVGNPNELNLMKNETHLSEGHCDGLWDTLQRLGLRKVFQGDAIALENHIWLAVDHQ